jgi:hypothetical protein
LRPARYELPREGLGGRSKALVHELPGRKRVAEAALFAIQSLSEALEDVERLTLTLRDRHTSDVLVLENAESARAWYRRHEARIPKTP